MSEPTYRDVAQWLPTDVREHIEATLPCPLGGEHQWSHNRSEIHQAGRLEPLYVIDHWRCRCGLVHATDPEKRR